MDIFVKTWKHIHINNCYLKWEQLYEKRICIHTNISLLSGRIPGDEAGQDSLANHSSLVNVEVFDLNGRKVFSTEEPFSMEKTLNLQGLQSGMYVVKLIGEGLTYSEKIVLN